MMKSKITLLLLLVLITLQVAVSFSTDGNLKGQRALKKKDDKKKKKKAPKGRNCSIKKKKNKVRFHCTSKVGSGSSDPATESGSSDRAGDETDSSTDTAIAIAGGNDASTSDSVPSDTIIDEINFEMKFDSTNGMIVTVEYKDKVDNSTDGSSTDTKTKFAINFYKVIEYEKVDSSATGEAFDWESDKVVKEFPLTGFTKFGEVHDDGVLAKVSVSTEASSLGMVTFTFTVSRGGGDGTTDVVASANKVKIDFELAGYEWAQSDTYVALLSSIVSQRKVEVSYGGPSSADPAGPTKTMDEVDIKFDDILDTTETGVFGAYTWASDAMARVLEVQNNGTNATEAPTSITGFDDGTNATEAPTSITGFDETGTAVSRSGITDGEGEPEPVFNYNGTFSELANQNIVPVDAVNIKVIATSPTDITDPDAEYIAFSFIGDGAKSATDIYWDPEAGVDYSADVSGSTGLAAKGAMLFSSACILAMTLLGLVV